MIKNTPESVFFYPFLFFLFIDFVSITKKQPAVNTPFLIKIKKIGKNALQKSKKRV